jgi:hypothetical protein
VLKEEHRLRDFQKRVLRRIFDAERVEVTEGWRKLLACIVRPLHKVTLK